MPAGLDNLKHIVVLMMENRSFDNLLGWLYDPDNPPPFNQTPPDNFDGLYGKELEKLSNPAPTGETIPPGKGTDPACPNPDPGEPYEDVYCQLYNVTPVPPLNQVPPQPASAAHDAGVCQKLCRTAVREKSEHDHELLYAENGSGALVARVLL